MIYVLLIILLIYLYSLQTRLKDLEQEVKKLAGNKELPLGTTTAAPTAQTETVKASQPPTIPPPTVRKPGMSTSQVDLHYWLTTDGLLKIGAVLVLLGIAWFISYAFAENWIGPMGRIALGLIVGGLVMLLGEYVSGEHINRGTIVMALGATTVLLTIFAARTVYGFFTPLTAVIPMLAAVSYVAISSVYRSDKARCFASVVGASVVPFLVADGSGSGVELLGYYVIIALGFLVVVSQTGWRLLSLYLAIVYVSYSSSLVFQHTVSPQMMYVLVFLISLLLYGSSFIMHMKAKSAGLLYEIGAMTLTTFAAIWWIYKLVPAGWQSLVTTLVSITLFLGAYGLFTYRQNRRLIFEYTALALCCLAASATFAFDGPVMRISYLAIVAAGSLLALTIAQHIRLSQAAAVLTWPVLTFSLLSLMTASRRSALLGENLLVLVAGVIITAGLGWFWRTQVVSDNRTAQRIARNYLSGAYLLFLFIIWKYLEMLMSSADTAHAVGLIVFSLLGLGGYIGGQMLQRPSVTKTSLIVLGVIIFRLITVEVWDMDLVWRVIVFILIGGLFMVTSFIKRPTLLGNGNTINIPT